MDLTILQQGAFQSTGNNVYIPLESGVDWMIVYNTTQAAANQTMSNVNMGTLDPTGVATYNPLDGINSGLDQGMVG